MKQSVPVDLIPIDSKQPSEDWARDTFRYAHCFADEITTTIINKTEDLQKWIYLATDLQQKIQTIRLQKANTRIIEVLKDYGVYLPSTGNEKQYLVNFDDVIKNISDSNWYQTRQLSKQALIRMASYGIFRRGYNTWAINAANEWLNKCRLRYIENTSTHDISRRRGKGFVYYTSTYLSLRFKCFNIF